MVLTHSASSESLYVHSWMSFVENASETCTPFAVRRSPIAHCPFPIARRHGRLDAGGSYFLLPQHPFFLVSFFLVPQPFLSPTSITSL